MDKVKELSVEYKKLSRRLKKIDSIWERESSFCEFAASGVGECDHPKNKSSNMVPCNPADCPLKI